MTTFLFFILCMPNLHSSIPSSVSYGTVMSEMLRIARSSHVITSYEKNSALIACMEKQGENRVKLIKQIMKAQENH